MYLRRSKLANLFLMVVLALAIPMVPGVALAAKVTISGTGITTQTFSPGTVSGSQICVFPLSSNFAPGSKFTVTSIGTSGARGCINKGSTTQMFAKGWKITTASNAGCTTSSPCVFTITVETELADGVSDVTPGLTYTYAAALKAKSTAPNVLGQDARNNVITLTAKANTLSSTGSVLTGNLINKSGTNKTSSVDYSINCGKGTQATTTEGWDTTSTAQTANCDRSTAGTLETSSPGITCPSTGVACHSMKVITALKISGNGHSFEILDSVDTAAANVTGAYGTALVNQALGSFGQFASVPSNATLFINFTTPLAGSSGGKSTVPIKGDVSFVKDVKLAQSVEFRSIVSNALKSDNQSAVVIPFAPGTTRVSDLFNLTAGYNFKQAPPPPGSSNFQDCARSWKVGITLERPGDPEIFFDLGSGSFDEVLGGWRGCLDDAFDGVNLANLRSVPHWNCEAIGEGKDLTWQQMTAKAGSDTVKLVALTLDPRADSPSLTHAPEAFDQRADVSSFQVQDKTFVPVESISFVPGTCDTIPYEGVFFRIDQIVPNTGFSFDVVQGPDSDDLQIKSCRYTANVKISSLNGPGTYRIRLHYYDDTYAVAGETTFIAP